MEYKQQQLAYGPFLQVTCSVLLPIARPPSVPRDVLAHIPIALAPVRSSASLFHAVLCPALAALD